MGDEIFREYGHLIISIICVLFVLGIMGVIFLSDNAHLFSSITNFIKNTYGGF